VVASLKAKHPTLALLALAMTLVTIATVWLWPTGGKVANADCTLELLSKAPSPDGARTVQYRRGVCDGGTAVLHTLEIARANQPPSENVPGTLLLRVRSTDFSSHKEVLPLGFRWVDNEWLEVTHPATVQFSGSLVLNGVRIVGNAQHGR
jgi:hypothetical protein